MQFVRVAIAVMIGLSAAAGAVGPAFAQSQAQTLPESKLQALRAATFVSTCAMDATIAGYEEYRRLEVVLTRKAGGVETLAYHDAKTHQRDALETVVFNLSPTGYYELSGTRRLNDDYTFMIYAPDQERVVLYDDQRQPVGTGKCEAGDLTAKRQKAYDTRHGVIASRPGYISDVRAFEFQFSSLAGSWKDCLAQQVNAAGSGQPGASAPAIVQKAVEGCDAIDQSWKAVVVAYGAYDPDETDDQAIAKLKIQQGAARDLVRAIESRKTK